MSEASVVWIGPASGIVVHRGVAVTGALAQLAPVIAAAEPDRPRWIWWAADDVVPPLLTYGVRLTRCWDLREAHRLLAGGWRADLGDAWSLAHGLDPTGAPPAGRDDLFTSSAPDAGDGSALTHASGHLTRSAIDGHWQVDEPRLRQWAGALADLAERQHALLAARSSSAPMTALSESAAAIIACELGHDGLPVDRAHLRDLIEVHAGPEPATETEAAAIRAQRDARVTTLAPAAGRVDLRNPTSVRDMLRAVGLDVPDTRKWTLAAYADAHPVVRALLAWRADERIATTYGYRWLATAVGPDERLRGAWSACDGAAGRMTAQNGLHNLPQSLRAGVRAAAGPVFVRADLGQIEPRVLAAVARDAAFADASRQDDLYAPVARALGLERPQAKVAVLAAMYGQTSGSAGAALGRLQRAFPQAVSYLDAAYAEGLAGRDVLTHGGRLVRMGGGEVSGEAGVGDSAAVRAARGRYARNAVIQGAAAELFKAWVATLRLALRPVDAHVVLCLHDEVLVHARAEVADQVCGLVATTLEQAARRYTGTDRVRFVADITTVTRWSEAKG